MIKKTVLVTGAAGFIDRTPPKHLLARGYRVIGLDNFCDFLRTPLERTQSHLRRRGDAI